VARVDPSAAAIACSAGEKEKHSRRGKRWLQVPRTDNFNLSWSERRNSLLGFHPPKLAKERLHLPGPRFHRSRLAPGPIETFRVLSNLQRSILRNMGRLGKKDRVSLDISLSTSVFEHLRGRPSFCGKARYDYFRRGKNIVNILWVEGMDATRSKWPSTVWRPGCGVSSRRKYAHKIPFVHEVESQNDGCWNLTQNTRFDQVFFLNG